VVVREEYDVYGDSPEELKRSLLEVGPRDETGNPRFARTEWTVEWRWSHRTNGGVDPASISLSCKATILLPRYVTTSSSSSDMTSRWASFLTRLEQHEHNHLKHVRRLAPEIKTRIEKADRHNGPLSPSRANRIAHRVIREMRDLDVAYDRQTEHGRTEGVWVLRS
jgi:predicted secreted Zn-dependent protease